MVGGYARAEWVSHWLAIARIGIGTMGDSFTEWVRANFLLAAFAASLQTYLPQLRWGADEQ